MTPTDPTAADYPRCCLCGEAAIARFELPGGCAARPDLTDQPLCLHHAVRAAPLDGMYLREDLTLDKSFEPWWEGRR